MGISQANFQTDHCVIRDFTTAESYGAIIDSGASAREARQRSTMGKKNW